MKKVLRNYGLMVIALFVAFSFAFSTSAMANDEKGPVELKFIGNLENQPVFQLTLNNKEEEEYIIIIRDEYGSRLYTDRVKGSQIKRKFMLNTDEIEGPVTVEIRAKSTDKLEKYTIDRTRTFVEETVVNKVD